MKRKSKRKQVMRRKKTWSIKVRSKRAIADYEEAIQITGAGRLSQCVLSLQRQHESDQRKIEYLHSLFEDKFKDWTLHSISGLLSKYGFQRVWFKGEMLWAHPTEWVEPSTDK